MRLEICNVDVIEQRGKLRRFGLRHPVPSVHGKHRRLCKGPLDPANYLRLQNLIRSEGQTRNAL